LISYQISNRINKSVIEIADQEFLLISLSLQTKDPGCSLLILSIIIDKKGKKRRLARKMIEALKTHW